MAGGGLEEKVPGDGDIDAHGRWALLPREDMGKDEDVMTDERPNERDMKAFADIAKFMS